MRTVLKQLADVARAALDPGRKPLDGRTAIVSEATMQPGRRFDATGVSPTAHTRTTRIEFKPLPCEPAIMSHDEQLLAEMHHRVANDLALIAAMLEKQRREYGASTAAEVVDQATGTLLSLAVYYRRLYESRDGDHLDLERHLKEVINGLSKAYLDRLGIVVNCRLCSVFVPAPLARDLGIILVELVANAAKHAFGGEAGRIDVDLRKTPEGLLCRVSDDGRGLPGTIPGGRSGGLVGATRLAAHFGGSLEATSSPLGGGAAFALKIPWGPSAPTMDIVA